ncbi:MAG: polysaccharide lyase family protein, partial [Planctomycetota bacterium]
KSYAEFAIAGDYKSFAGRFDRKPLVFEIGKSEAAKDWPFIHPGPVDFWAHGRVYPFTVRFSLADEPRGVFCLRVEFTDVQAMNPPAYTVTIGERSGRFHLEPGGGDASLTDPKAGKPQKIEISLPAGTFHKGVNNVVLACVDGSWVQYDALTLLNDPEGRMPQSEIQSLRATATPFFIRVDGKVRRALEVSISLTAPAEDLNIRVEAAGEIFGVHVKELAGFGGVSQEIGVPDSPEPLEVELTAKAGASTKTATVKIEPQRKWRIYCGPSSHTDIGYTDVQPKCAERHCENLDRAEDLLEQYPDFRWNTEVAWQAENYLASRTGARRETFLKLAKEGKLGIQALYANILTGLCSPEAACRLTYFAHSLKTRYGIPFTSAMISDVPTQEASLPMILASSGIRYFSSGINNDRGYTFTQLQDKCPCWWEGPDGSRVLMMYTWQYAQADQWALTRSLQAARAHILGALKGYEARANYPYDAVWLHGAVSDNQPLNQKLAEVAKAWNERYEFPKIILSPNAEFFEYIEKNYGAKLPVVRGSAGTYWEDGAGSSAAETILCRNAQENLAAAEEFLALARRIKPEIVYSPSEFYSAWRNCLLYDEHTWGAHCSISQPDSDFTKAQWKIKAQFAIDAGRQSQALLAQGTAAIASLVKTDGPALVVINPSSWPRTDVIELKLPAEQGILQTAGGPACFVGTGSRILEVKDVPPFGYRVLKPGQATVQESPISGGPNAIESRYYRVTFDPDSGAVTSLFDKELQRELVDPQTPYRLNQYIYVAGGKGSRIVMNPNGPEPQLVVTLPQKATLCRAKLGGLGERLIVNSSSTMTPKLVTEITVWNDIKRVDIVNRLTKTQTYDKEGVYFAFPFAAAKPVFRYECPAGIVNANKDMLPGACLDWFTVQHFVEVESSDAAIAWATPDAPLVCFQDINRGKWQTSLPFATGQLYAYVMNNYWHTNYKAGQGGDFTFRFAITSRAKTDNTASAQFGWAVSNPLLAIPVEANANAPLAGEAASLLEVAEPNVILIGAKQAEEGGALVLRFWEVSGQATTAHLRMKNIPAKKATACNLVEEPQEALEIKDGVIAVPVRGSGLATVLIE